MKAQNEEINQDGSAGEFSQQGACATPVNAAAVAAKYHAPTLEYVLAGGMTDARRRCAVGCWQDYTQQEACQAGHPKEGVAR